MESKLCNQNVSDSSTVESSSLLTESDSEPVINRIEPSKVQSKKITNVSSSISELGSSQSQSESTSDTTSSIPHFKTKSETTGNQNFLKFDTPTWYMNPCFSRYWEHYQKVMQWCQKHYQTVKILEQNRGNMLPTMAAGNQYCNPRYWNAYFKWCCGKTPHAADKKRCSKKKRKRKRKKVMKEKNSRGQVSVEEMSYEEADTDEFEMEITDEMKEFFAQSEKHRQERDAKREEKGCENKEETFINIEDLRYDRKARTSEAPTEQPGLRKDMEMKLLYGKGSPMIQGMETAIQMSYCKHVDIKQPKIWPNIPLKITFS